MMHVNKQALKFINKSNKRNKSQTAGKELVIPIGNHVLLRDHPEGRNKIQNRFKSDVYVVVDHHKEPNVYYIRLLSADKDSQPKVVNRGQLFDLKSICASFCRQIWLCRWFYNSSVIPSQQ